MERYIVQMQRNNKNGVCFFTFPALSTLPGVTHAFSTRHGGVSQGVFSTMNLNFNRGDSDANVLENYRRFCLATGFDLEKAVASSQDHHTNILRVTAVHSGLGILKPQELNSIDGLLTDEPGITLVTYYADCVPLYFLDIKRRAIGLAHAGWRGTVAEMGMHMVCAMKREFGTMPDDLQVAIGPSIGPCCYEVDAPVCARVANLGYIDLEQCFRPIGNGKAMLDLWSLNCLILEHAGVPRAQIVVGGVCTCCNSDTFFSHRVMGAQRGGMAAMLALN